MSRKKKLKKIVKLHLNRIQDDGKPLYHVEAAPTVINREKQLEAEKSLGLLDDATLAARLGILNLGTATEALNIDDDAGVGGDVTIDAFPADQREVADADSDGIGDNREIVTLYQQLLAIQVDSAVVAARATAAATLITTTGTQLAELQAHESAATGGDGDTGAYDTALGLFNAAVTSLETIRTNAQAKLAEAVTAKAAMLALPQPRAGIKYDTFVAKDKYDAENGGTGIHAAIVVLVGNIDTAAEVAGDPLRVANADRTAAGNTTRG